MLLLLRNKAGILLFIINFIQFAITKLPIVSNTKFFTNTQIKGKRTGDYLRNGWVSNSVTEGRSFGFLLKHDFNTESNFSEAKGASG